MTGISSQEHYVDVSTQKRDDNYVITSVWFSQEGGNKYLLYLLFLKGRKAKSTRNFREVKVAMYINHRQVSSYPVGIGGVGLMVPMSVCPQQSPQ